MPKHSHVVGGSTAALRRICNASIDESYGVVEEPSIYAATGTALHTITEIAIDEELSNKRILKEFTGVKFAELLNDEREIDMFGSERVTKQMLRDKAIPAVEFFDATVPETAEFHLEKRVHLTKVHKDANGLGDVFFVDYAKKVENSRAGLIDWKFGDGHIVSAEGNDQMRFYLAGAIADGILPVVNEYEAYIFQPAASLEPDQFASKATFTYDDLQHFTRDLRNAVQGERRHVTGPHCKWCKGRLNCKPYNKLIKRSVDTDVRGMNTRKLGEAMDLIPAVEAWVKAVKEAAQRNALDGKPIPGYVLDDALSNTIWYDEESAWAAMGRALGIPANDRAIRKVISPAECKRIAKELDVDKTKVERFLKKHTHRPVTGQKLRKLKAGELDKEALASVGEILRTMY